MVFQVSPSRVLVVQAGCVGRTLIWQVDVIPQRYTGVTAADAANAQQIVHQELTVVSEALTDARCEGTLLREIVLGELEPSCCHLSLSPASKQPQVLYLGSTGGPIARYNLAI